MKKVISACIDKVLEFDSPAEGKAYLDNLKKAGKQFRVMYECDVAGGKRQIRIKEQYNKSPMIEG